MPRPYSTRLAPAHYRILKHMAVARDGETGSIVAVRYFPHPWKYSRRFWDAKDEAWKTGDLTLSDVARLVEVEAIRAAGIGVIDGDGNVHHNRFVLTPQGHEILANKGRLRPDPEPEPPLFDLDIVTVKKPRRMD